MRYTAEVSKSIVVNAEPVCNIAAGHAFDVKVVAVGKRGYKYGYFGFSIWTAPVAQPQRLSGVVKFEADTG